MRVDTLQLVCHTVFTPRDGTHPGLQMTTFLTTAQREFLIEEYKEQLEEFEQLEEYGYLLDELRKMNNTDFWQQCIEFMPIYGDEPGHLQKMMAE